MSTRIYLEINERGRTIDQLLHQRQTVQYPNPGYVTFGGYGNPAFGQNPYYPYPSQERIFEDIDDEIKDWDYGLEIEELPVKETTDPLANTGAQEKDNINPTEKGTLSSNSVHYERQCTIMSSCIWPDKINKYTDHEHLYTG